jgi:hypothetical protein
MNLLEVLSTLSANRANKVELEKAKEKVKEMKQNLRESISSISSKTLNASFNVSFSEIDIDLIKKILEEISCCLETYILNFDNIRSGYMKTRDFQDILRQYTSTNILPKINFLFTNIYLE